MKTWVNTLPNGGVAEKVLDGANSGDIGLVRVRNIAGGAVRVGGSEEQTADGVGYTLQDGDHIDLDFHVGSGELWAVSTVSNGKLEFIQSPLRVVTVTVPVS